MHDPHSLTRPSRRTPAHATCCHEPNCGVGLRNNFFSGKRLTPYALRLEQGYFLERRRLINRAVHGFGVVYGFPVRVVDGSLEIGAGLAFDAGGRELVRLETASVPLDEFLWFDARGKLTSATDASLLKASELLLGVHYAERLSDPVRSKDACCDRDDWDRTCETVRFSLRPAQRRECCAPAPCGLDCECASSECCGESQDPRERVQRGGYDCLCKHVTALAFNGDASPLCAVAELCDHVKVALDDCVPLACVALALDGCGEASVSRVIEACGPRPLVKRNELLFDLIRGCDLTHIDRISWASWHRAAEPIAFEDFRDMFGARPKEGQDAAATQFEVHFSRPVRLDSLADSCTLSILQAENREGWLVCSRAPIVEVRAIDIDDQGRASGACLVVDAGWLEDALYSNKSTFFDDESLVEIEVRGDFIVDCNGQSVDANSAGRATVSGNGTPGGTFLSTFRVERRDGSKHPKGSGS